MLKNSCKSAATFVVAFIKRANCKTTTTTKMSSFYLQKKQIICGRGRFLPQQVQTDHSIEGTHKVDWILC